MADISYAPLIEGMTWSYSRIKTYEDCPYRWFLKYIRFPHFHGDGLFFAEYGKFLHELIAGYYSGEQNAAQTQLLYLEKFKDRVRGRPPTATVFQNYFSDGARYLRDIRPPPYPILAVEKQLSFHVSQYPFTGFIDFLGDDSGLVVGDHKSRKFKPRSGRSPPTKGDLELDDYLRQLYLYSVAIESIYGSPPKRLCINAFRSGLMIDEPYREEAKDEACDWAKQKIEEITTKQEFDAAPEYFKCRYLCEMHHLCEYFPA